MSETNENAAPNIMDQKDKFSKAEEKNITSDNEKNSDSEKEKNVESIIQKWLKLQKTIKEEITLEDVIIRHQSDDFFKLKDYFKKYYTTKLQSRQFFDEIKSFKYNVNDEVVEVKKFELQQTDLEKKFLDLYGPIKNLLFLFRNNYDYITTLISSISENDKEENISSLVELFCNQFYENILIPNPEQEELLILIYKLLEKEITPMNSASVDDFLNEDSFLGKFISSFMKRPELKVFLSILINPIISEIENSSCQNYLGMSLLSILKYVKKSEKNVDGMIILGKNPDFNDEDNELENTLLKDIPKTTINYKKNKKRRYTDYNMGTDCNDYYSDDEEDEDEDSEEDNEYDENNNKINENNNRNTIFGFSEYNEEYEKMISLDYLDEKKYKQNDETLKEFYSYLIEQIPNDPDVFSNKGFLEVIKEKEFKGYQRDIIEKYKYNFLFIKDKIDFFLQSLIDKIGTVPYTIRCICKIISLLMNKSFPLLFKYLRNCFIGKLIFDKCIFPVLSLENKYIIENKLLSVNTKKCLNVIISVLSKASKCSLFNYNIDTEKTIFNHYLIEIIPLLNKFYDKLIDIELPKTLDDLVTKTKLKTETENKIYNFRQKKINNLSPEGESSLPSQNIPSNENILLYDYFNEHSDEILHLQSICFSLNDVLYILNLLNRDLKPYNNLPKNEFFKRTYDLIKSSAYKLDREISKDPDKKKFFVIFQDEKNTQLEQLLKQKKKNISTFTSENQDTEIIGKRFKFCIKTVLKGLNLLNNKDYPYLNMASSSSKFFTSLKYTLDDFGEFSEVKNKIPLKWYGQYICNSKELLDEEYKKDDYLKLYEEIYNDELNSLNELKNFSSTIIARDGMNIRCAEKILEKSIMDLEHIAQAKEFIKIEKFVDSEIIEVCVQTGDPIDNLSKEIQIKLKSSIKKKLKKEKDNKKETLNEIPIVIEDGKTCIHKEVIKINNTKEKEIETNKKIPTHAYSIKSFIKKFSENPWKTDDKNQFEGLKKPYMFVLEDINNGTRKNKIFETLKMYMNIVKNYIKNPIINKDLFSKISDFECNKIAEKIEDHIMRQLYIYVFPKDILQQDKDFFEQTLKLEWVKPEHLDIKKIYINQLKNAVRYIRKIEEAKSLQDKLLCIKNASNTMNNTIKFSSEKHADAGQDELTPIFQYIIIKSQPKRMISNINYIKCFLDEEDLTGEEGFFLTQMESAVCFINGVTYEKLKITETEFESNVKKSELKYKLKILK